MELGHFRRVYNRFAVRRFGTALLDVGVRLEIKMLPCLLILFTRFYSIVVTVFLFHLFI